MNPSLISIFRPVGRSLSSIFIAAVIAMLFATRAVAAPVDVNSADADALADALNGVGPKIAAAIVSYRKQHGPFKSVDDLLKIKGIGPKILERNKQDILLKQGDRVAKTVKMKK